MISVKLKDGFTIKVRDDFADDWELMKSFAALETNPLGIFNVVTSLLDADQCAALEEHAKKNGRVSAKAMMGFIQEIFESDEVKNFAS